VSWFNRFFNKDKDDFELIRKDIPLSTIARWYIYDTELGEPNEVSNVLGLNMVSDEGDEKEREDSELRLRRIEYLLPFIHSMSDVAADIISGIQIKEILEKNPDAEEEIESELDLMRTMYKVISLSSLIGAFSSAMEIGLIHEGNIEYAEWENRVINE
jgi:hypothetical protein